jgi:hypothetical protein
MSTEQELRAELGEPKLGYAPIRPRKDKIRLPANGWEPRPYQLPVWEALEAGAKRLICCWHRRSGKDEVALHWAAIAAHKRPAMYWHMLPEQAQARKAVWNAINPHTGKRRIDEAFPLELRETTREDEMLIRFKCGSIWQVVGSDNYNSLVGSPPAGVVFSEWALANPASWGYLRPILVENGGWALFITTPRGHNHAKAMLDAAKEDPDWYAQVLSARETNVFSPQQLASELKGYADDFGIEQGKALFEQEYMCSFDAAILGSFYAEELAIARAERRIGRVPSDRMVPVQTSWDLGYDDATAIWFIQVVGREVRIVDYYEASGMGFDHYATVLEDKKKAHHWRYSEHWFPHDVGAHELSTGTSRADTLRKLGIVPTIVPSSNVSDGINATRRLISRAWIDEERCKEGLSALANYRREWDADRSVWKPKPVHDWSSHCADALRTFAEGFGDTTGPVEKKRYGRDSNRPRRSAWAS